ALGWGMWGGFVLGLMGGVRASYLLEFWELKVVGGLYLLYLAVRHFAIGEGGEGEQKSRAGMGFWATVVSVELADIAFSIDSILAAVGTAEGLPGNLQKRPELMLAVVYIG